MKTLRFTPVALLGGAWVLTAGVCAGGEDPSARREVPAVRIAAAIAAHEDPLAGLQAEVESWWDGIAGGERPVPTGPLPEWMIETLKRRRPEQWLAPGDYAGWAAILSWPDRTDVKAVLKHLATPKARASAAAVAALLTRRVAAAVDSEIPKAARETLRAMGGSDTARALAAALKTSGEFTAGDLVLLHELAPGESVELIADLLAQNFFPPERDIPEAIGKIQDPRLADVLVPLVDSSARETATAALAGLRELGSPYALEAALHILGRGDLIVSEPLRTIGELGDHRLYPLFGEYLEDPNNQEAAATAAARAGLTYLAPRIANLLSSQSGSDAANSYIRALAVLEAREFIPLIAEQLVWEPSAPAALAALAKLNAAEAVPRIRALLYRTPDPGLKAAAVRTLVGLGVMGRAEAGRFLASLLDSAAEDIPAAGELRVVEELVRLDAVECIPSILHSIGSRGSRLDDFDFESPQLKLLHQSGASEQTAVLRGILRDGDFSMRRGCLRYLYQYRVAELAPDVTRILQSAEPEELRLDAIRALARVGNPDSFLLLAGLLLQREPEKLQLEVMYALSALIHQGKRLPGEVLKSVRTFVAGASASAEQREYAIGLLGNMAPGRETDELLLQLLHRTPGEPERVQEAIAGTFSAEAPKEAAAFLAARLRGPDWNSYYTALEGLDRMNAREFSDDVMRVAERGGINPGYYAGEYALKVLWRFGDRRCLDRMGTAYMSQAQSEEEAASLLPGLANRQTIDAFALMEGVRMTRYLPWFLRAVRTSPGHRAAVMFAARMLYADSPELILAWQWLGSRTEAELPPFPVKSAEAQQVVRALNRVRQEALSGTGFGLTIKEAGVVIAKIVSRAEWSWRDADWIESVAVDLGRDERSREEAGAVMTLALQMHEKHPLRLVVKGAIVMAAAQPVAWLLVLLFYPWSRLAQRMVWTRWVRRWLGLGWVEPLVLNLAWLRRRMWKPFREALVPPAEVVSFDEWTFFDSVRVAPASGGDPQPALKVLSEWSGVAVVRGESGQGKTTLLHALAGQTQHPVALLRAAECDAGLIAALRKRLPREAQGDPGFLRALVQRRSPGVLIDAVHEAPPEVRAALTEEVNALRGASVLLTTQPLAWSPPQGAVEWQMVPLQAGDIAPFLHKQGTAAVEGIGGGPLPERQRAFAARVESFLHNLEQLAPNEDRAVAMRRMLGNPMEAVLAAELLAAGQRPDPERLLEQRMEHLAEHYAAQCGEEFPAAAFAGHLRQWRVSGAPDLRMEAFAGVASFLAQQRLMRKCAAAADSWRFRHDKLMEWFLRAGCA